MRDPQVTIEKVTKKIMGDYGQTFEFRVWLVTYESRLIGDATSEHKTRDEAAAWVAQRRVEWNKANDLRKRRVMVRERAKRIHNQLIIMREEVEEGGWCDHYAHPFDGAVDSLATFIDSMTPDGLLEDGRGSDE